MARRKNVTPQSLMIELRTYKLESVRLQYSCASEDVRRLADLILDSLLGSSFPKLARMIGEHQDRLADSFASEEDDTDETSQDERADLSQDESKGEPARMNLEPAESLP